MLHGGGPAPLGVGSHVAFEKKLLTLLLAGDAASSPRISGSSFYTKVNDNCLCSPLTDIRCAMEPNPYCCMLFQQGTCSLRLIAVPEARICLLSVRREPAEVAIFFRFGSAYSGIGPTGQYRYSGIRPTG